MRSTLLISLGISLLAVIFALQNGMVIDVDLGPFTFQGSVAFILLVSFVLGVIVGILAMLPSQFRKSLKAHKLQRTLKKQDRVKEQASTTEALPEARPEHMVAPPPPQVDAPAAQPASKRDAKT